MAHAPGDLVYSIRSIRLDDASTRVIVDLRYGVVDRNGTITYRATNTTVTIDVGLATSLKTAVAALVAANLPSQLVGAVPE
jgi:hypothetical protein